MRESPGPVNCERPAAPWPCNRVVRRGDDEERTAVDAIDPQTMEQLSGAPRVRVVADDVDTRLRAALAALSDTGPATN